MNSSLGMAGRALLGLAVVIVGCSGGGSSATDGGTNGSGGGTGAAGSGGDPGTGAAGSAGSSGAPGSALCRINAMLGTSAAGKACRSSCASKLLACEEHPSCIALDCCLASCNPTDTACNTACSKSHLSGVTDFAYANQCVSNCAGLNVSPTTGTDAGAKADAAPACTGRFEIIDPGNERTSPLKPCPQEHSGCDGSGLVKDTQTGLQWQRHRFTPSESDPWFTQTRAADYCSAKGMRLPTQDEAMGIMKTSNSACAWPSDWWTWTSTESQPGEYWYVMYNGNMLPLGEATGSVLCVK